LLDGAAERGLTTPRAAGIAGIAFAVLFVLALVFLRDTVGRGLATETVLLNVTSGSTLALVGLYLVPFAGIAFLWFIGVVRDRIGEREDKFFATVFFGSGLLFVALVWASAAASSAIVVGVRYFGLEVPPAAVMGWMRSLAYALAFAFATRAAAVFMISAASIGLRSRTFPNWFAWTGYLFGAVLLLGVAFWDWIILLLPAWVAAVSLFILRRERARSRTARKSTAWCWANS